MEFRTCPSCKASVLEDDVEDCPFCGASMSGKPSAKPAPKPSAPGKPAAGPSKSGAPAPSKGPSSGAGPGKPAAGAARSRPPEPEPEKSAESDDPFEVDSLALKNAAPVSPKPAKGRTVEVKCPMCETVGYIAPAHGGKDVKCCNPACRLPIFKAPKTQVETKAEPEKGGGLTTSMLAMIAVLVLSIGGAAVYWFVLREQPKPIVGPVNSTPTTPDPVPDKPKGPTDVVIEKEKIYSIEEIRQIILKEMPVITIQNSIRSRPLGRQIAAEAALATGDLAGAKEQLEHLNKLGKANEHYLVEPAGILLHQMLSAGDQAGADPLLTITIPITKSLPEVGRSSFDATTVLASAAARMNRAADATPLLERQSEKDSSGRGVLSLMWTCSFSRASYQLSKESQLSHLELAVDPLWAATCVQLCRFGQWDAALSWAKSSSSAAVQDASQAVWAGMLAAHLKNKPNAELDAKLKSAIDSAGLAAKVRMKVAVAEVGLNAQDPGVTAATATEIEQLLAAAAIPAVMVPPDLLTVFEGKGKPFGGLPDPRPNTSLALAFADVANLKMRLGDKTGGWAAQEKAMSLLRSVAPSPAAMQILHDQTKGNTVGIEAQLDSALKLGGSNQKIKIALSQYRTQLESILKLSNERYAIQQTLLRRAARMGLIAEAWSVVVSRNGGDANDREPYMLKTSLPKFLHSLAAQAGIKALMDQIVAELPQDEETKKQLIIDKMETAILDAEAQIQAGKLKEAANSLKSAYTTSASRYVLDRHVLETSSRLADQSIVSAQTYIRSLPDPTVKEDAYRMLAAFAVLKGKHHEFWVIVQKDREVTTTEKVMSYLGYLEAMQATGAK